MNDLVLRVERIVRPIRATQGRKLRMRVELLAHLTAAFDEERAHASADDALERAARRLGDPAELTRALQRTVPVVERVLLARLLTSARFDAIERRMARVPGICGTMTLGHMTLLAGLAASLNAPFVVALYAMATPGRPAVHLLLSLFLTPLLWSALLVAAYRFVFAAAGPGPTLDRRAMIGRGVVAFASQLALVAFGAYGMANRLATGREFVGVAVGSIATLLIAGVVARWVGVWRRPYDEWLSLDIATT